MKNILNVLLISCIMSLIVLASCSKDDPKPEVKPYVFEKIIVGDTVANSLLDLIGTNSANIGWIRTERAHGKDTATIMKGCRDRLKGALNLLHGEVKTVQDSALKLYFLDYTNLDNIWGFSSKLDSLTQIGLGLRTNDSIYVKYRVDSTLTDSIIVRDAANFPIDTQYIYTKYDVYHWVKGGSSDPYWTNQIPGFIQEINTLTRERNAGGSGNPKEKIEDLITWIFPLLERECKVIATGGTLP